EMGLRPSRIAGTSIGAIYGAAAASGLSAAQIRAFTEATLIDRFALVRQLFSARSDPRRKALSFFPVRSAFLKPETVIDYVLPPTVAHTFADLTIPLEITATDISTTERVVLTDGDLPTAIAASIAIPILFSPVSREDRLLLDGGLTNPCPYDLVQDACDITIAIDVSGSAAPRVFEGVPTAIEVGVQTSQIMQKAITRERLKANPPDVYIDVALDQFTALEFYKAKEIIEASLPVKDELRAKLSRILGSETI
ncbi:MAG: patatin-like phospholipase family protein, partial [Pseudomonadota bacterium]